MPVSCDVIIVNGNLQQWKSNKYKVLLSCPMHLYALGDIAM